MKNSPLFILDSYGLIYRSYYAFINRPLVNEKGENVSAVFGFFRNLAAVFKNHSPKFAAAAFDSRTPTFRHEMYKEYKATRQKTPEDLHAQIPIIEEILTALGIQVLRADGFEADDIIAAVASYCESEGRPCRILSGDKDLMQLVTPLTIMMKPDKAGGWENVDEAGVEAEWGVPPSLMLDMLSLVGDTADNVPGLVGVGPKTAQKLLTQYGSAENMFAHADEISGALGAKIRGGREAYNFSSSLIKLRCDVPVKPCFDDYCVIRPDFTAAARLLQRYGAPAVARQYEELAALWNTPDIPVTPTPNFTPAPDKAAANGFFTAAAGDDDLAAAADDDLAAVPEGQLVQNEGNYRAVTDLTELEAYISECAEKKTAAYDSETDSLDALSANIAGFSLSHEKGTGIYVPLFVSDTLLAGSLISKKDAFRLLEKLFTDCSMTIVMHNAKFDYHVLKTNGYTGAFACTLFDTMIAAWVLSPDRTSFGLEQLSERKLGLKTTPYIDIVPKGSVFPDVPIEKAAQYAAEDADLTLRLFQLFAPMLEKNHLMELFTGLEMAVLPILADMERTGIHIETEELAQYATELEHDIRAAEQSVYENVGHEFNIASTKQLQEVLFVERGLTASKKTKTGFSTDTSVLEELALVDSVPAKILEFRTLSKLLSTYVKALPLLCDTHGRVHTSFIQTGTATGRLSSRDPNLQNIPVRDEAGRRIRRAFSAEKNNVLISADYAQIELVILAHLSGDKNLCDAFIEGKDVHKATAALIYDVPAEHVTPEMRRTAKTINFGVMYGMSAFRLSNELGIPRKKAQEFIDSYFATYSGISSFIQNVVHKAEQNGYVETILGRRRFIKEINSKNKTEKAGAERIAVNTPIQGSAADIVKKAMIAVSRSVTEQFPEARLLLQVHDELILECPEHDAQAAAALVKKEMESVITLKVPLRVSVETGKRWGDFH